MMDIDKQFSVAIIALFICLIAAIGMILLEAAESAEYCSEMKSDVQGFYCESDFLGDNTCFCYSDKTGVETFSQMETKLIIKARDNQ